MSPISINDPESKKLKDLEGKIEFKDVYFEYPARYGIPVLN